MKQDELLLAKRGRGSVEMVDMNRRLGFREIADKNRHEVCVYEGWEEDSGGQLGETEMKSTSTGK